MRRRWLDNRWSEVVLRAGDAPVQVRRRVEIQPDTTAAGLRAAVEIVLANGRRLPSTVLVTTRRTTWADLEIGEALRRTESAPERVRLGALVRTRADAQRVLPELATSSSGAVRALVLEPTEEIDLVACGLRQWPVDWLLLRGAECPETPMHPLWVREIVATADRLGIPLWWESWGLYVPHPFDVARPRMRRVLRVPRRGLAYPETSGDMTLDPTVVRMLEQPGGAAPVLEGRQFADEPRGCPA